VAELLPVVAGVFSGMGQNWDIFIF